jgi:cytoskeletal protein CcmA (bactofilin family)
MRDCTGRGSAGEAHLERLVADLRGAEEPRVFDWGLLDDLRYRPDQALEFLAAAGRDGRVVEVMLGGEIAGSLSIAEPYDVALIITGDITDSLWCEGPGWQLEQLVFAEASRLHGDLWLQGAGRIAKDLALVDACRVGNVYIGDDVTVGGQLHLGGDATADGLWFSEDAHVDGGVLLSGSAAIQGDIWFTDRASIDGGLRISGRASVDGVVLSDEVVLAADVEIAATSRIGGELWANGSAVIAGNLSVGGQAEVGGNLWVTDAARVEGSLEVITSSVVHGEVRVSDDATVGVIRLDGFTTVSRGLSIIRRARVRRVLIGNTLEGDLTIDGWAAELLIQGSILGTVRIVPSSDLSEGALTKLVSLNRARFDRAVHIGDQVSIATCDLRQCGDLDRLDLVGADLFTLADGTRAKELVPPDGASDGEMASIYRQLRVNLEGKGNRPASAFFYRGEMDSRRRAARQRGGWTGWTEWGWLSLYRLVAGYGLRVGPPLLWFAALVGIGGVAFHLMDLGQSWPSTFVFTVHSMLSLFRPPEVEGDWAIGLLQVGLRIVGPILLGLAAFAVRDKVAR